MNHVIDLDQVDQYGPQTQQTRFELSSEQLGREELTSGVEVDLDTTTQKGEMDGEYLVSGKISYQGELSCARCLEPFPFASRATFDLRYRPRPEHFGEPEAEIEIADQDLDLDYYDGRTLPLELIAQEQVQLSLPMKPLCDEACQGLCPKCGTNLTRGTCKCAEEETDERWTSLREFRELLAKKNQN